MVIDLAVALGVRWDVELGQFGAIAGPWQRLVRNVVVVGLFPVGQLCIRAGL